MTWTEGLLQSDRKILRDLGVQLCDTAHLPEMEYRRSLWRKLNSLNAVRPMLLVETSGVMAELLPELGLKCIGEWARSVETRLRLALWHFENIPDDMVAEPRITYSHRVVSDFYGVELVEHVGNAGDVQGSRSWEPPVHDLAHATEMLRPRRWELDLEAGLRQRERLEEVFAGVLPVEYQGWYWWSTGMTENLVKLIGLERMMLAMTDEPDRLHALMAFLRDDMHAMLDWHKAQGLLLPNNGDDYIGSGGRGYTDRLPQSGYTGGPARICDMWGLSESQETVGVSPRMFGEFVFPYQLPLISRFGLAAYGCCEPVEKRWQYIRRIPNLCRVSVSPWANQAAMAEALDRHYVFNRKPNPTLVSTQRWDENAIRADLATTLSVAKGCNVDIVLKDVHTVCRQPWRLGRWAEIGREEIAKSS